MVPTPPGTPSQQYSGGGLKNKEAMYESLGHILRDYEFALFKGSKSINATHLIEQLHLKDGFTENDLKNGLEVWLETKWWVETGISEKMLELMVTACLADGPATDSLHAALKTELSRPASSVPTHYQDLPACYQASSRRKKRRNSNHGYHHPASEHLQCPPTAEYPIGHVAGRNGIVGLQHLQCPPTAEYPIGHLAGGNGSVGLPQNGQDAPREQLALQSEALPVAPVRPLAPNCHHAPPPLGPPPKMPSPLDPRNERGAPLVACGTVCPTPLEAFLSGCEDWLGTYGETATAEQFESSQKKLGWVAHHLLDWVEQEQSWNPGCEPQLGQLLGPFLLGTLGSWLERLQYLHEFRLKSTELQYSPAVHSLLDNIPWTWVASGEDLPAFLKHMETEARASIIRNGGASTWPDTEAIGLLIHWRDGLPMARGSWSGLWEIMEIAKTPGSERWGRARDLFLAAAPDPRNHNICFLLDSIKWNNRWHCNPQGPQVRAVVPNCQGPNDKSTESDGRTRRDQAPGQAWSPGNSKIIQELHPVGDYPQEQPTGDYPREQPTGDYTQGHQPVDYTRGHLLPVAPPQDMMMPFPRVALPLDINLQGPPGGPVSEGHSPLDQDRSQGLSEKTRKILQDLEDIKSERGRERLLRRSQRH